MTRKLAIFGLTVSSSWGNGHATLWRGLCRALAARGWHTVFYERDQPFYAGSRDLHALEGGELVLYRDWADVAARAREDVRDADAAIVTSFCPDGIVATELVCGAEGPARVFYDLDTPVTLDALSRREPLSYVGAAGFSGFDLVLSYTGGPALDALRDRLGARRVAPLYGHVDPDAYRPGAPVDDFAADLSYIGTYAADRQAMLETLFMRPAARRPGTRFVIAGAQYPADFPWTPNIFFVRHLPPALHPAFYASSRLTLNVTRAAMAANGWCPSGRLFEAAACGAAIVSDWWPGLDRFFEPDREILVAESEAEMLAILAEDPAACRDLGRRARERVLAEHTSAHRAAALEAALEGAASLTMER